MRRLSILILISLLPVLPSCKFIKEKGWFGIGKKERTLEQLKAEQDSIRVADSLKIVENRLRAIEEARLDSIRMAGEAKQTMESRYKYNIIVGSFITPEYARNWAEEYLMMGYGNTRIIEKQGSNFELVSAEAYDHFGTAFSRLQQFQDTVNIDAWLYILK